MPLQEIINLGQDMFVTELHGECCVVDKGRQPENGSRILVEMCGMFDWGRVILNPERIVTDEGLILDDDLLEDVRIVGVVAWEINSLHDDVKRPTI